MNKQVKSRQRVSDHGEVFTAEREVKAMCDLVADECTRVDSRFLEPACGEGNFLLEILSRKLKAIEDSQDYQRDSLLALSSLYGIDILPDNVQICRYKLFDLWNNDSFTDELRKSARTILNLNIICGDSLEYKDYAGNPITFAEWTFNDDKVARKDFEFRNLVEDAIHFPVKEYPAIDYWRLYEYDR